MSEARVESASKEESDPQVRAFERFLKTYHRGALQDVLLQEDPDRLWVFDYWGLDKFDPDLAAELLERPHAILRKATAALATLDFAELAGEGVNVRAGPRPKIRVAVNNLPDSNRVRVRDLRAHHIGKLLSVSGLVKKVTEVRAKIVDAVYECLRCGALLREAQEEHLVLKEPVECYEDQGGCGRQSNFKLIVQETRGHVSRFVDTQKIELQEAPEGLRGGQQPQRLVVYVEDELCARVEPGDRVTLNGILRSAVRKTGGVKSTVFDHFLEGVSIEAPEKELEDVEISPEEDAAIRALAQRADAFELGARSIAPNLYGLQREKGVLLLQLFGGVSTTKSDGTRLRGDIHVLLVGDPGVAKSQLIRFMQRLAPRGIYTSGKSTSGAGLTAAAVQDDFGEGRWTLEAGAMVLADRGLLCVDELDKVPKGDQSAMHEGMEQQTISVSKAGINATLHTRCSVLGAANPKHGRFEEFSPLPEQIDFPPALLSRFDVILVMLDKANAQRDRELAEFIVDNRASTTPPAIAAGVELVATERVRKWAALGKTLNPVVSGEARDRLVRYFVTLRDRSKGDDAPMPITARQLEGLVRLTEASARVRLSSSASAEDAERAIEVYEYALGRLSGGQGILDVDLIASGVSHDQRAAIGVILELVRDLSAGTEHGAPREDVVSAAAKRGVPRERAEATLDRLKETSQVFCPRGDHYRVVRER